MANGQSPKFPPQYNRVRTKPKRPDLRDDRISRALSKASGIERIPPNLGERVLGDRFGGMLNRLVDTQTEGMFSEEPGPVDLLMTAAPFVRAARLPIGLGKVLNNSIIRSAKLGPTVTRPDPGRINSMLRSVMDLLGKADEYSEFARQTGAMPRAWDTPMEEILPDWLFPRGVSKRIDHLRYGDPNRDADVRKHEAILREIDRLSSKPSTGIR